MIALLAALSLQAGWTSLTREFDAYATRDSVVGASLALVEDGRLTREHFFGLSSTSPRLNVSTSTIYHWASITKTLNAVAIMQLRDRGLLSLDDPVTRWVPELRRLHNPWNNTDAITLRMLLGHSGGFRNGTWPYASGQPWEPFEPAQWDQLVAMMPYQRILFAPDSRYGYSNPAFIYTARVVEAATADPWQSYIYKNLWLPLGMTDSYFNATPWHQRAHRSHNYVVTRDSATGRERVADQGTEFDPGITIPNSGWNAPLSDLAKWLAFLAGSAAGGDSVLSRRSLEEMWVSRFPVSGYTAGADSMGLSFFIYGGGERLIGHTGDQAGYRLFFLLNPRTRRGVIAAFNTRNDARAVESDRGFRAIQQAAARLLRQL